MKIVPLFFFGAIPVMYFIYYFARVSIMKAELNTREKSESQNRKLVETWLSQFDFLYKRDITNHVYHANGKITGRINVSCYTEEQKEKLLAAKDSLPGDIYLWVHVHSENEKNELLRYRNWLTQFDFLSEKEIHDGVYYNDSQGLHGKLLLSVSQENLSHIKQKVNELPSGIKLAVSTKPERFGLLINLGPNDEEAHVKLAW
jgi:hypothetical protein